MKKYGLILSVVLVCTFFQSCIYDKIEGLPVTPAEPDGKCYMSLRFEVKQQRRDELRTRTFKPTYEDEDYERKVSDFRIFLVKRGDPTAQVIEIKDVLMKDETTTEPFEINPQWTHGYLLYVVANSAGTLNLDLSSAEAFRGTYVRGSAEACAPIWEPNHFLMVNTNNEASDFDKYTYVYDRSDEGFNLEHTDLTPYGGISVEIDDNMDYTYDSPYRVPVKLERVAAKIVVDCNQENFDFSSWTYKNKFHDVHVDGVAMINDANCFNLVQQWQIACYQGEKFFGYEWNKIKDDQPEGAPFGYPYLWPVTPVGNIGTIPSQIYYSQLTDFTDFDKKALRDGVEQRFMQLDANKKATMYCLENVTPLYLDFMGEFTKGVDDVSQCNRWMLALQTGMRNRVTGVLFRVRAKVKDDSHNTGDLTPDPDKGKWDQAKTRTAGDDDFRTFYCYRTSVSAHLEELLKLEPTLSEKGISIASTVKELRNAGVKVYENGYMYYMHWIKDQNYKYFWNYPNESDEGDTFHYYAVLRNTRYEVNVTDVEEIGMDLPGREVDQHGDIIEGRDYMLYPVFKDGGYDFEMDEKTLQELKNKAI